MTQKKDRQAIAREIEKVLAKEPGLGMAATARKLDLHPKSRAVIETWHMVKKQSAEDVEIPITFEDDKPEAAKLVVTPAADRTHVDKINQDDFVYPVSRDGDRILMIPDTHAPYHDPRAWSKMIAFAKSYRPTVIIHVGDFADCYVVSDHDKDPRRGSSIEQELNETKALREELDALPNVRLKILTLGNHETRLARYLMRNCPALIGLLSIEQLLGFPQAGWKVVPYQRHAKIGKLHATHDTDRAGVYATRMTAIDFCASIVFGHTHRLEVRYFGDALGEKHVVANLGCLLDLDRIDYMHRIKMKDWQHGFGAATMQPDGLFALQVVPVVDGRIIR